MQKNPKELTAKCVEEINKVTNELQPKNAWSNMEEWGGTSWFPESPKSVAAKVEGRYTPPIV